MMKNPPLKIAALALVPFVLAGCSVSSGFFNPDKVQYETPKKRVNLDIPPDLGQIPDNDRFAIPDRNGMMATEVERRARNKSQLTAGDPVLPQTKLSTYHREYGMRWISVAKTPDELWEPTVNFWNSVGLAIDRQNRQVGVMQTNWAENRAKLPHDVIRATLGRIIDMVYSTGERDSYRCRLERNDKGGTDIFISHRQMVEVYKDSDKTGTVWQPGPKDPQMEAEMLTRLAQHFDIEFGALNKPEAEAASAKIAKEVAAVESQPPKRFTTVEVDKMGVPTALVVNEPFDRVWRRISVTIDRLGINLEDRDRNKGIFYIKYLDPDYEAAMKKKQGMFAAALGKIKAVPAVPYQVILQDTGAGATRVTIAAGDGSADKTGAGHRILALLDEQIN